MILTWVVNKLGHRRVANYLYNNLPYGALVDLVTMTVEQLFDTKQGDHKKCQVQ